MPGTHGVQEIVEMSLGELQILQKGKTQCDSVYGVASIKICKGQ